MIFENIKGEEFRLSYDMYLISNYGRIYSFKSYKFISYSTNAYGYFHTSLTILGKTTTALQHRLIALAFIPNKNNKPFINHINGIKKDNSIENLEWCTAKENTQHALKLGLIKLTSNMYKYNCINCGNDYMVKEHIKTAKEKRNIKNNFCNKKCLLVFNNNRKKQNEKTKKRR